MSPTEGPAWLAELQARFGAVLRTPLEVSTGTLRADLARYSALACDDVLPRSTLTSHERLAVYNRQYWYRLFTVLQRELPLVSRLCGLWAFNQLAMRYLLATPPSDHDLRCIVEAFPDFVAALPTDAMRTQAGELPHAALLAAARLDTAYGRVFFATEQPPFRPTQEDANTLADQRLQRSEAVLVFTEHWPLVRLRSTVLGDTSERAVTLPPPLSRSQSWLLLRTVDGVRQLPLPEVHAWLLVLLEGHTLREALAELRAECAPDQQRELVADVRRWLAQDVKLGIFRGQGADIHTNEG